ncbi:pseudouridine synthase [Agromyces sp. SYSU T0242]|uniref:pseudouridine synthase n=1 Tax=Agromyces litoreus TaxID=3158561 RepID=UPI003399DC4D
MTSSDRTGAAGDAPEGVRLQKALAAAGVASRRVVENLIVEGRIEVNGRVVTELGTRIDPLNDRVAVDGTAVQLDQEKRYFMLNKPRGVVSSMRDEQGRPDLRRFTDPLDVRVYNVGRLDGDTSGLLLLTNDGELAHVLAHPSFGVEKTYVAKVTGRMTPQALQQLKRGIELDDGPIRIDRGKILQQQAGDRHTMVEVTLHSGRNRIVRRMLDAVGHPVVELVRRQFGPLHLGTLRSGAVRELSRIEVGQLLTIARAADAGRKGKG